jgi:hypothetical protein
MSLPILAACGDNGDKENTARSSNTGLSESVCSAGSTFESAVNDLGSVDVVQNGTAALDTAVDGVSTAFDDLVDAARSEIRDEANTIEASFDTLSSTVSTIPDAESPQAAAHSLREPLSDFIEDAGSLATKVSQGCD